MRTATRAIRHLMCTAQSEHERAIRVLRRAQRHARRTVRHVGVTVAPSAASMTGAPCSVATRRTTATASGGSAPIDHRHPGLDDAGLLEGDLFEGVAEVLLMVVSDRGDGTHRRSNDVGRVESAAEADLDDRDLDAARPEQLERGGGRGLEEVGGTRSSPLA
jgi:hypothetical protein